MTLPGISDAQGTVASLGVCGQELALGLLLHLFIWLCSHRIIVVCSVLTPVPGGVDFARGIPQTLRVGEGAGHVDGQTLMHPDQFLHSELIARLLLQRPWGDTKSQLQPQPLPTCPFPTPGPLTRPQQGQQQQGHHDCILLAEQVPVPVSGREMPSYGVGLRTPQQEAMGDRAVARPERGS